MTDIRRNSTEILVVGPFVTSAGVAVTSMVLASASAAYAMLHDTSNAVDISGYTVATATCPGYFYLTLASAITSVVGPAVISVQNPTVHLPVEKDYQVLGSAPFDALYASAPTIITTQDIGLVYESTIASATSAQAFVMSDAFPHSTGWIGNAASLEDVTTGYLHSTYISGANDTTEAVTIGTSPAFTPAAGDALRIYGNMHPTYSLATDFAAPTKTNLDNVFKTVMTEGYASTSAPPTVEQALYLIQGMLTNFGISGTTLTVKKLDQSTTAATFTLDDASAPTSLTRAT